MLMREPSITSQSSYPPGVHTIFMQVCKFYRGACFGLGLYISPPPQFATIDTCIRYCDRFPFAVNHRRRNARSTDRVDITGALFIGTALLAPGAQSSEHMGTGQALHGIEVSLA